MAPFDPPSNNAYVQVTIYNQDSTCGTTIPQTPNVTWYRNNTCMTVNGTYSQKLVFTSASGTLYNYSDTACANLAGVYASGVFGQCTVQKPGVSFIVTPMNQTGLTWITMTTYNGNISASVTCNNTVNTGPTYLLENVCLPSGYYYTTGQDWAVTVCTGCNGKSYGICTNYPAVSGVCTTTFSNNQATIFNFSSSPSNSPSCAEWGNPNPTVSPITSYGRTGFGNNNGFPVPCSQQNRLICFQQALQCPCQNGATCVYTPAPIGFNCTCPTGYVGTRCQTSLLSSSTALATGSNNNSGSSSSTLSGGAIAGIAIAGLVFITGLGVLIVYLGGGWSPARIADFEDI